MIQSLISKTIGINPGIPVEQLRDKYLTPESEFLDIDGMELHYRKTGTGPALLLIHGIGSCLHTWSKWHEILSDDFTVISLDLPGFGLTGPPPSLDYSIEMYMRTFDKLLDHLGVKKILMAGNSLGGLMTWNYAFRRPERVKKIVLLNAAGFNIGHKELADFGFILSIHPLTRRMTHVLTPRSLVRQSLENAVHDASLITDAKVILYHDMILRKGNRESFSEVLENLIVNGKDNTRDISSIAIPTLIMWGDEDALINVSDALKFKQSIKDAELLIYEDIGHLPMLEIPERSAMDVKKFLKQRVASAKRKQKV